MHMRYERCYSDQRRRRYVAIKNPIEESTGEAYLTYML